LFTGNTHDHDDVDHGYLTLVQKPVRSELCLLYDIKLKIMGNKTKKNNKQKKSESSQEVSPVVSLKWKSDRCMADVIDKR